jgi:hypothetical protein
LHVASLLPGAKLFLKESEMQTVASRIAWQHDYEAALEQARTEHKFVLLDIFNPG